jgi:hypothetical protein
MGYVPPNAWYVPQEEMALRVPKRRYSCQVRILAGIPTVLVGFPCFTQFFKTNAGTVSHIRRLVPSASLPMQCTLAVLQFDDSVTN